MLGAPESWHIARVAWPVVFGPLLLVAARLLCTIAPGARAELVRAVRVGVVCLAPALAFEASSPLLFLAGWEHGSWPYELEVALEEGLELLGWIVIAAGVTPMLDFARATLLPERSEG